MQLYRIFLIVMMPLICIGQSTKKDESSLRKLREKLKPIEEHMQQQEENRLKEFNEFIAIPSVSSLSDHAPDVDRAAAWLVSKCKSIGMSAQVHKVLNNPIVFAEWNKAKGKPTVLVYGHYDVQPVKEEEWDTPPFTGTRKNDRIYARGAADDKGGIMMAVWAVESMLQKNGSLPVNIKFVFEGGEELGSPGFRQFLETNKAMLQSDFAYNADGGQESETQPEMSLGLRGVIALEFTLKTANKDLHSGVYGGKTPNAAKAMAEIISSFYNPDGSVAVKGFYDKVTPLTPAEQEMIRAIPYDPAKDMEQTGATVDVGDINFSPLERIWFRPTLEINGVWSGYIAKDGFSTIIPGAAHARLSCRLVENQNGREVISQVKQHIEQHKPAGTSIMFKDFEFYASPIKYSSETKAFQMASHVLEEVYQTKPLYKADGGSIGAMSDLKEALGTYAYSFGFVLPDENFHAANEFIRLGDIRKGQIAYCLLFTYIGTQKR